MKHIRKPLYYGVRLRDGFKHNFVVYKEQPFAEFDIGIPKTSQVPPLAVFLRLYMQLVKRTWSVTTARHGYINCTQYGVSLKSFPIIGCNLHGYGTVEPGRHFPSLPSSLRSLSPSSG